MIRLAVSAVPFVGVLFLNSACGSDKSSSGTSPTVLVSGIALSSSSATLSVGATTTLTANVSPSNATTKSVTWASSYTSVATVNGSGVVTGVSAGSANITATAQDGSGVRSNNCSVIVTASASANANLRSLQLATGTLSPTFDPSVTSYEAELSDSGATVAVTATAADSGSTIHVQNQVLTSGATTPPITVRPATMNLEIDVDAADGLTYKTYTVVVHLRGWQLNETNTGLTGAGIDRNTLPVYNGPLVGGIWHEPPAGTVISLKRIDHPLSLIKGNITIDRCWIRPTVLLPAAFIYTFDFNNGNPGADTSTIVDCDIDGTLITDQAVAGQCAVDGLATVQRNNIFGMGTGIAIFAYGLSKNIAVEQNYVHDLRKYGDAATGSHNESLTIRGFLGLSLTISNNRLVSKTGNDSGAIFIQPYADYIDNTLIDGNLLETYGWCIPLMTQNHDYGTNMRATNNRFVNLGYGPGYVQGGPGWTQWENNYYDDANAPGHKGQVAVQPR